MGYGVYVGNGSLSPPQPATSSISTGSIRGSVMAFSFISSPPWNPPPIITSQGYGTEQDGRNARVAIAEYLRFYNTQRPHQALECRTPAEVFTSCTEGDVVQSRTALTSTEESKTAGPNLSFAFVLSN